MKYTYVYVHLQSSYLRSALPLIKKGRLFSECTCIVCRLNLRMMLCTKLNDVIFLQGNQSGWRKGLPLFLCANSTKMERFFMHDSAMLNCLCKTLFFKLYVPFLSKKENMKTKQ